MSETREEETPVADTGRVGFRDIYRAVGETETRLSRQLEDLGARLLGVQADHESRLRALETTGSPDARAAKIETTALGVRVSAVETAVNAFKERERGIVATLGAGKTLILLIAAIASPMIAVLALIATRVPA